MIVAVISDTHMPRGPRRLSEACVARLAQADAILHAGDFMALEVLRDLQALGPPVYAVKGNVDSAELQMRLPLARIVELGGARIALLHDAGPREGRLARLRGRFPDADAVIFGHSHLPLHERGADGLEIFNPGSPTERRRAPHHTMGMLTIEAGTLSFDLIVV